MSVLHQLQSFLSHEPSCVPAQPHLRRLHLPVTPTTSEPITCVYYNERHFITGTDIIRALVFRFRLEALPIGSLKKFEEGVFSDLRTLKPGVGAVLEPPRSEFLQILHRHGCIRTQKKQKVFLWKFVDFERLFKEAEKRERKREVKLTAEEQLEWERMQPYWQCTVNLPITVELLTAAPYFPSPQPSPQQLETPCYSEDEDLSKLLDIVVNNPELVAQVLQDDQMLFQSSPKMIRSEGGNRILMQSPLMDPTYGLDMLLMDLQSAPPTPDYVAPWWVNSKCSSAFPSPSIKSPKQQRFHPYRC